MDTPFDSLPDSPATASSGASPFADLPDSSSQTRDPFASLPDSSNSPSKENVPGPSLSDILKTGMQEGILPTQSLAEGYQDSVLPGIVHDVGQDIKNAGLSAGEYVHNFNQEHETVPGPVITPKMKAAAKLLGAQNALYHNVRLSGGKAYYSDIYKLTPQELKEAQEQYVQQHGGNLGEEEERNENTLEGGSNLSNVDFFAPLLGDNPVTRKLFYPKLGSTILYQKLQDTMQAMDVVQNPKQYNPDVVKKAGAYISALKRNASAGILHEVRGAWEEALHNPGKAAIAITAGGMQMPEVTMIPEFDLGELALGGKVAKGVEGIKDAKRAGKLAQSIKDSIAEGTGNPVLDRAAQKAGAWKNAYQGLEEGGIRNVKRLQKAKESLDTIGKVAGGAGINAGTSYVNQLTKEGYVKKGSLALPALAGGMFGAVSHLAEGVGRPVENVLEDVGGDIRKDIEGSNRETAQLRQGAPGDVAQPHEPGQPIPTNAPINDTGTIPYTGGASPNLKETHIDKNFPTDLPIKDRNGKVLQMPVKDIVAKVHEAEEAPLMHPTQPLTIQQYRGIVDRAGPYATKEVFSPGVQKKILTGKPLTYPEAHEIATAIENNHVSMFYNVDPEEYQGAMKPYIKDIAERSEEEPKSDIPANLDTKPYDDMDHPEVVEGKGKPGITGLNQTPGVKYIREKVLDKSKELTSTSQVEQEDARIRAALNNQEGFISPATRKLMLAGTGATIGGMYGYGHDKEHPLEGALKGAAIGLGLTRIPYTRLFPAVKSAWRRNNSVTPRDILNTYDYRLAAADRLGMQKQLEMDRLLPSRKDQEIVTDYLQGNYKGTLTAAQQKAANIARTFFDNFANEGMKNGVLKDVLLNYVPQYWKQTPEQVDSILQRKFSNMSPQSIHAIARKIPSYQFGEKLGLTPRTKSIGTLMRMYNADMSNTLANKELLESLKDYKLPNGMRALMPPKLVKGGKIIARAPSYYVPVNHPQLHGYVVDPDIANSLEYAFRRVGKGGAAVLNAALKRNNVALSMFHPLALAQAFLTANNASSFFRNLGDIAMSAAGKSRGHRMLEQGQVGDSLDKLLKNGLTLTMRKGGKVSDEDMDTQFYDGLQKASDFADQIVPGLGKYGVGAYGRLEHLNDKIVFENTQTGLKAITALNKYEEMKKNWGKWQTKNPGKAIPTDDQIAQDAAKFANDVFGGQNWRRVADDATTHLGKRLGNLVANPSSREVEQFLTFAPDWTVSTFRSYLGMLGKGSGIKGLLTPKTAADLYRQYTLRNAIMYFTLYDGLNMALSGHHIWQNGQSGGNPFYLDMGNGEHMQINKHAFEVPEAVRNPSKYVLGKMGVLPSEALDQLEHREFITPEGGPPMKESRVVHALKRTLPFSAVNMDNNPKKLMYNMMGLPIYGKDIGRQQYKEKERYLQEMRRLKEGQ